MNEEEVALLREWIKQGAKYDKHWSYKQTVRPEVPSKVHPVDHFIRKRLQAEGIKPSARADRRTLARRVSLDLIGLPPKLDEVNAFVADKDPKAYENLVARLLARPEFGEHWARMVGFGPLCRLRRLRGRSAPYHLGLSGLRHSGFQQKLAF